MNKLNRVISYTLVSGSDDETSVSKVCSVLRNVKNY
jgi:hypothetical protein